MTFAMPPARDPFAPLPVRDAWHATRLGESSDAPSYEERYVVAEGDPEANLIGSSCGVTPYAEEMQGWTESAAVLHMPVLDIDVPHRLVPSETPGHSHLYIDVPVAWETYAALIKALGDAGILEPGYVSASLARRCTFVSPRPWKMTPAEADAALAEVVWSVPSDGAPEPLITDGRHARGWPAK